jgi:hypothetical protein
VGDGVVTDVAGTSADDGVVAGTSADDGVVAGTSGGDHGDHGDHENLEAERGLVEAENAWMWADALPGQVPVVPDFTDAVVPSVDPAVLPPGSTAWGCFSYVYDDGFYNHLVVETERYARVNATDAERRTWKPITVADLLQFFAFILHVSIVKKPRMDQYFSEHPVLQTGFAKSIGLNRSLFRRVMKYLHLVDNEKKIARDQPGFDPLYKVRFMLDHLVAKFKVFRAGAKITLDEALCPFRGRVSFRVYMKNKPNKYGFRIETVCDARTGCIYAMEVYSALGDNSVNAVVTRLTSNLENKNHRLYMDRRYCSPTLFKLLLSRGIFCVGTVMKNQKFLPIEFKNNKLKRGEKIVKTSNGILATQWRDKIDVFTISTVHGNEMVETDDGRRHRGTHETLKPATVVDYNRHKAGVDKLDQMASYYPFDRKTVKWWKKLFFQLFQTGLIHAQKYYNLCNPNNQLPLEAFILDIALQLSRHAAAAAAAADAPPRAAARQPFRHLAGVHFPQQLVKTTQARDPTRDCVQCSRKRQPDGSTTRRRETRFICMECKVALCPGCFYPYHFPHGNRL